MKRFIKTPKIVDFGIARYCRDHDLNYDNAVKAWDGVIFRETFADDFDKYCLGVIEDLIRNGRIYDEP